MAGSPKATAQDPSLRYDVVVDPSLETSHGKLVRYTGHGKRVLDLGCSTGGIARALSAWDCKVWGVEIDAEAAKLAEPACEQVIVGNLDSVDLEVEFQGHRFDVVLAGDVLEHVLDPLGFFARPRHSSTTAATSSPRFPTWPMAPCASRCCMGSCLRAIPACSTPRTSSS